MAAMKFGFGQAITRKEDDPLLRGAGCYVDDVSPQGRAARGGAALDACARENQHRGSCRRPRHEGRAAGADREEETAGLGPLPTPGLIDGFDISVPYYPILVLDVVRHVGDAIAFVVADTLAQA